MAVVNFKLEHVRFKNKVFLTEIQSFDPLNKFVFGKGGRGGGLHNLAIPFSMLLKQIIQTKSYSLFMPLSQKGWPPLP
jgi:hypothetical protein